MMTKPKENIAVPDLFSSMMQGDSEQLQIAKELFTEKSIDMKTELSKEEINIFSRAEFMKDILGLSSLEIFINKFEKLRVSMNRQGRKEFVETVKNKEPDNSGQQFAQMFKSGKL